MANGRERRAEKIVHHFKESEKKKRNVESHCTQALRQLQKSYKRGKKKGKRRNRKKKRYLKGVKQPALPSKPCGRGPKQSRHAGGRKQFMGRGKENFGTCIIIKRQEPPDAPHTTRKRGSQGKNGEPKKKRGNAGKSARW